MENEFSNEMKSKSSEDLKEIAVNFWQYRGALVAAAKNELDNRGIELSDNEKQTIEEEKNRRKQDAIENTKQNKSNNPFISNLKLNIVTDTNAPQLYSRQVIYIFSILFSLLFGGILLVINLNIVKNKKGLFLALLFSILYAVLMIVGLNYIDNKTSFLTYGLNAVGAIILDTYFWKKYIGVDFKYRTKPIWIPLIIGIVITILLIIVNSI